MSCKLIFLDTETTGVDPEENGIHQISGIMVEEEDEMARFRLLGKFNFKMAPHKDARWDLESFVEGRKVIKSKILTYKPQSEVFLEFNQFILGTLSQDINDRYIIVGYNIYFDIRFIRNWFILNDANDFFKLFWGNYIDVQVLASEKLKYIRHKLPNFKLETIAKHYKIPVDSSKCHDAMYDAWLTQQIYYKLR